MPDGPMTQEQAAVYELGLVMAGLPSEVKAALAAGAAAAPGEVVSALTGGLVTALPEGQDFDTWLASITPDFGMDNSARSAEVVQVWAEPARPKPDEPFTVGLSVSGNGLDNGYKVSFTVYDREQNMLQLGEVDARGDTATVPIPPLPQGEYYLSGYSNSEGVDLGETLGEAGYRSAWYLNVTVGQMEATDDNFRERIAYVSSAIGNLLRNVSEAATHDDLVDALEPIVGDLTSLGLSGEGYQAFAARVGWLARADRRYLKSMIGIDVAGPLQTAVAQLATIEHEDRLGDPVLDGALANAAEALREPFTE